MLLIDFGKAKTTASAASLPQLLACSDASFGAEGELLNALYTAELSHCAAGATTVAYTGRMGVRGYACEGVAESTPWTFRADLYSLCACLHLLLFAEELSTTAVSAPEALRRGFANDSLKFGEAEAVRVPTSRLKRCGDLTQ